jgi:hypothetical protein
MLCATIREGQECTFMAKKGCSYTNGECEPAVDPCQGCGRLTEVKAGVFCATCPAPATKWRLGLCNQATHVKEQIVIEKTKLNPIKASKRMMKV